MAEDFLASLKTNFDSLDIKHEKMGKEFDALKEFCANKEKELARAEREGDDLRVQLESIKRQKLINNQQMRQENELLRKRIAADKDLLEQHLNMFTDAQKQVAVLNQ